MTKPTSPVDWCQRKELGIDSPTSCIPISCVGDLNMVFSALANFRLTNELGDDSAGRCEVLEILRNFED